MIVPFRYLKTVLCQREYIFYLCWKAELEYTAMKHQEVIFFLSALRKNFPKELPSMEWQFYRQSSSTIEIIPGMGSELEYFI